MISAPGIGSGLDVGSLVAQLVALERDPLSNRLDLREIGIQSKISAFGSLKSAFSAFEESVTALKTLDTFQGRTATTSDKDVFSATATSDAATGSYDIEVVKLAKAHKLGSVGFASSSSVVGSGELTIQTGNISTTFTIDSSANTLADIRDAINNESGDTGVSATVITVDDGLGGSVTKLQLTADNTGIDNEIVVTVTDDDGNDTDTAGLSQLVYDPDGSGVTNLVELQAADDAQIAFDSETVTTSSNTISGAIEGVTLTLLSDSAGATVNLKIENDNGAVKTAVEDFVSTYNDLRTTITDLTKYNPQTEEAGILIGDTGLLSISNQLQSILGERLIINGSFMTLSDLGIRTQTNGTLQLEGDGLDNLLAASPESVEELFVSSGGIGAQLELMISGLTGGTGTLDARTNVLNEQVAAIADERVALENRLVSLEQRLLRQFSAMDALVAELTATSNFLTQQLASVPVPGSSNS